MRAFLVRGSSTVLLRHSTSVLFPRPSMSIHTYLYHADKTNQRESDSEKLEFSTNATAGAYCGLPFGGSSYDCTSIGLKKLQRAALANGHQWYYQLMHVDCFETQNGELCLVTGCDKASYWATGVFSSATSPVMKRMVMPHVDAETGAVKTGSLRIENWTPRAAQVDFAHISGRPDTSERLENQDSCITLRGFHIGLHDSLYNMAWCPTSTCQTFWQALPWPIQPRLKPWPVDSEYVAVSLAALCSN